MTDCLQGSKTLFANRARFCHAVQTLSFPHLCLALSIRLSVSAVGIPGLEPKKVMPLGGQPGFIPDFQALSEASLEQPEEPLPPTACSGSLLDACCQIRQASFASPWLLASPTLFDNSILRQFPEWPRVASSLFLMPVISILARGI